MKKISILLLLFITVLAVAQKGGQAPAPVSLPVDSITKLITYEGVVQVPGVTKAVLYKRAMDFFQAYYKNPTEVIRDNDSTKGVIVGKPRFRISNPADKTGLKTDAGLVQYTITLSVKEGRFKYELTAFNWKQPSYYAAERWMATTAPGYLPVYNHYLTQTDEYVRETLKTLKPMMTSEKPVKDKDNW